MSHYPRRVLPDLDVEDGEDCPAMRVDWIPLRDKAF